MMQTLSELILLLQDIQFDLPASQDPVVIPWEQWAEEGAARPFDTVTHSDGIVRLNLTGDSIVAPTAHEAVDIVRRHEQISSHADHPRPNSP